MEQSISTNTEGSPPEAKDLEEPKSPESVEEKLRALQKKLDDKHQLSLELQRKLKVEEQFNLDLQAKLDHDRQLKTEQISELQLKLERQLKGQDLEQHVETLQPSEKAQQESSLKKDAFNNDAVLRKFGLTEKFFETFPADCVTKARLAFEMLSYENAKLKRENLELREKTAAQAREIAQLRLEISTLYAVIKKCPALAAHSSLEAQRRKNADQALLVELGLSCEELKIRCDLLSKINTIIMTDNQPKPSLSDPGIASTSKSPDDQHRP